MQIRINLQIFLFIILFLLTKQIELYALIMLFALIHELGHIFAGLLLKLKPKKLNIMPFGLAVTFESYDYRRLVETKKILIAFAGPLTNILISVIALFIHIDESLKQTIIYSNILVAVFNLVPIYPLDGGRILKGCIKLKHKNNIIAESIVNKISNILAIILTAISSILILYLKNISILLVIMYLWIIVIKENKKFNLKKKVNNIILEQNEL